MTQVNLVRRAFLSAVCSAGSILTANLLCGEEPISRDDLKEPLLRISKKIGDPPAAGKGHPLDAAIDIANEALKNIQENIQDYSAVIVKRERVSGKLVGPEYMMAKIRNRKVKDDKVVKPFSVYLYFKKPEEIKGREVIYVEGQNNGKMIAHEANGWIPAVWLKPEGPIAMRGNLYPITELGIENLIVKLLEKGHRDRKRDECEVEFRKNAKINGRPCTLLNVVHPIRRAYFDFNLAQIFIDDEFKVPIRYSSYNWPAGQDNNPSPTPSDDTLFEEYTYTNLKLNIGLKDIVFDEKNPEYGFVKKK